MSSISDLMKEYFDASDDVSSSPGVNNSIIPRGLLREGSMPIEPSRVEWEIHQKPERFVRKFEFQDRRRLIDFLNDIFELEDEMKHHADIRVTHKSADVRINTHTLEKITELDVEFTRAVDKIYRDVLDYSYDRSLSEF